MQKITSKKINTFTMIISMIIVLVTIIAIVFYSLNDCCQCGDTNNKCCPCSNTNHIEEVEQWYGHDASSAGSWEYMCRTYKEEHNKTFECFT